MWVNLREPGPEVSRTWVFHEVTFSPRQAECRQQWAQVHLSLMNMPTPLAGIKPLNIYLSFMTHWKMLFGALMFTPAATWRPVKSKRDMRRAEGGREGGREWNRERGRDGDWRQSCAEALLSFQCRLSSNRGPTGWRKETQDAALTHVYQSVWAVAMFFYLRLLNANKSVSCLFASLPAAHRHVLLVCCVSWAESHMKQAKTRPSSLWNHTWSASAS